MSQIPFADIRAWMFDAALPFWGSAGVDHVHGGFHEALNLDGSPAESSFKRTRVICRQVYAFSHAALLGWAEGDALAKRGFDYLSEKAFLGFDQGWARRLTREGALLDPTPDLYDIAFAAFALAWRYRQSHDGEALNLLHSTFDFVDFYMRAPGGMGFVHENPPQGPRLQNPHMHLLEASIAAYDASKDQRFLGFAEEIADLFKRKFFDGKTLAEYFTPDLKRLDGEQGRIVEPGHQLEWAWILAQFQRISGTNMVKEAEALVAFAEAHGVDQASHVTFDEVRDDGAPLRKSSRTWPNTERIKGHLALFELTGADPRPAVAGSARLLLDRYLAVTPRGGWIDQFDADGKPLSANMPTSTFYHVFLAFAEILRLQPKLEALA
ncbi:MAG: AGE family epimerase/isomerase [Hyphomonadaceae bacterium]|nr:AGE family epimerase/isomerase [Hyphomonadaceae bacterium]